MCYAARCGVNTDSVAQRSHGCMVLNGFVIVAAFATFVALLGLGWWSFLTLSMVWQSRYWQRTRGVIHSSEVVPNRRCNGLPGYHYVVDCEYRVGDLELNGPHVRVGKFFYMSRALAQRTVDRYPAGTEVDVFFDPAYPECAVLEPGWSNECFYPLALFRLASVAFSGSVWIVVGRLVEHGG